MANLPEVKAQVIPPDVFSASTMVEPRKQEPSAIEEILRLLPLLAEATVFPLPSVFTPSILVSEAVKMSLATENKPLQIPCKSDDNLI